MLRLTPLNTALTGGPKPVPSPVVVLFVLGGSSAGGVLPSHDAWKLAVIVPSFAVCCSVAAAVLAYSVTWNASDFSLLRYQPLITVALCGPTITRLYNGSPFLGPSLCRNSLN
jgi:hypothetical protein